MTAASTGIAAGLSVGIEKLAAYPCTLALDMRDLCAARGHDIQDIRDVMMIDERSLNPPWEDPVTMAVNCAKPMLTAADRESIELLIVASESGVDAEKPMSTWVHRYLELKPQCRNFELKHACYGGTAALQMAAAWVGSPQARGAKALVVCTDQSRMHFGKPWEFVMGAGAASFVVSRTPRVLALEPESSGYWTNEVSDLTRPTSRVETGNSETSLLSYLDGLHGAYAHYTERVPAALDASHFAKNIYHAPFGGMTLRAHKALLGPAGRSRARESFAHKTEAALTYVRRMGGTYAASTFIQLMAMIEQSSDLAAGERVGIFSYGSGSCAEMYSGLVGPEAKAIVAAAGMPALLESRRKVTVREYEDAERERTCYLDDGDYVPSTDGFNGWYDARYRGRGQLVFRGNREHYRQYEWS